MGFPPLKHLHADGTLKQPTSYEELMQLVLDSQWKWGDLGLSFVNMSLAREPCSLVGSHWYAAPEIVLYLHSDVQATMHTAGLDSFSLAILHWTCR